METEIEKLKKIYLRTEAPVDLEFYGFEDVLSRIQGTSRNAFYIYRYVGVAVLALVVLSGFVGITFASKPNSTLYPLKIAAQKAIADIAHTTPKNVENTINNFIEPQRITPTNAPLLLQSAPTPTPTPVQKRKLESQEKETQEENTEVELEQNSNTPTIKQDVKGISITKTPEVKQNSQQQEQSHSESENRSSNRDNTNSVSRPDNNSSKKED